MAFFFLSSSLDSPVGQAVEKTSDGLHTVTHPLYCQSPPAHDTYNPRAQLWSKDAGEDKNKHISFKSVNAGVTLCVTSNTQFVWLIWATWDASTGKDLPTNTRPKRPMAGARRSATLTSPLPGCFFFFRWHPSSVSEFGKISVWKNGTSKPRPRSRVFHSH